VPGFDADWFVSGDLAERDEGCSGFGGGTGDLGQDG
jgi:hypothetical protein